MELPTLDNVDVKDKTVIVRVDINSPLDPKTGEILDDTRIRESAVTIKELSRKGAKIVLLAHQGRLGESDFTILEQHAKRLSEASGVKVTYLMDLFYGPEVTTAVAAMKPGEAILLENVRFLAEESVGRTMEEQAKTRFVRMLAPLAQIFVNDAFAAAQRPHASIIGFTPVLPSYAGRLMEKEVKGMSRSLTPERPCVYLLGGAKCDDVVKIMENSLSKGTVDKVLTGGLLANIFLMVSGKDLGGPNVKIIMDKNDGKMIERAKRLHDNYGDKIMTPVDFLVEDLGKPKAISMGEFPKNYEILDVGPRTIAEYSKVLAGAKTIIAKGPMGRFEKKGFERGTVELFRAMANSKAYTILGGGHTVAVANSAGLQGKINHISTGGGASVSFLSGGHMPGIEALLYSKQAMQSKGA